MPTTSGSVKISYRIDGDRGSPVLMIMGYTMPGRAWGWQVPALSRHHRVVTFDNRGIGDSDTPPGPWSMDDLAGDTLRLIDHLDMGPVHLVGVSMGGMVAQHLALLARSRLRSLSLIATHAGGVTSRFPTARGLKRFAMTSLGRGRRRRTALERLLYPDDFLATVDDEWLEQALWNSFSTPPSAEARLRQLGAVVGHATAHKLHRLRGLPTVVISPDRDLLVRPRACRALAELIPHARLHRIARSGHGVLRQCADEVNSVLLEHFALIDRRKFSGGRSPNRHRLWGGSLRSRA